VVKPAPKPAPAPAPAEPPAPPVEEQRPPAPMPATQPEGPRWTALDLRDPTWVDAPICLYSPGPSVVVIRDTLNRLWGWQDGASCAFKYSNGQPVMLTRTGLALTWEDAPDCPGLPDGDNSMRDQWNRYWGWHDGESCAFRLPTPPPPTWDSAPTCYQARTDTNSVRDWDGRWWGWEDDRSCAFRVVYPPLHDPVWDAAPWCREPRTYNNSVQDTMGRWWGWQDERSCRY
jgi:hypothetical protein